MYLSFKDVSVCCFQVSSGSIKQCVWSSVKAVKGFVSCIRKFTEKGCVKKTKI